MNCLLRPILWLACAVLLASLLPGPLAPGRASAAAAPQEPISLVSALGGTLSGAYVDGSLAYLIEGARLTVLDISDPAAPQVRSRTPIPGTATQVAAANGFAYLLSNIQNALWVYDARDPAAPRLVRQRLFEPSTFNLQMWLTGGALWVRGGEVASRFDLRDPASPALTYTLPCSACAIRESGARVYLLQGTFGLQVWDLSDPSQPAMRAMADPFPLRDDYIYIDLALSGDTLYLSAWRWLGSGQRQAFVATLDVSDLTSPTVRATAALPAAQLSMAAGHLVTVVEQELRVYRMSDPAQPTLVLTQTLAQDFYQVTGDVLYAGSAGDWRIIDLHSPGAPVQRGVYRPWEQPRLFAGVQLGGQRLYAGALGGLRIIDVSSPLSPTLQGLVPAIATEAPGADATRLALVDREGLRFADLSDPLSPRAGAVITGGLTGVTAGGLGYALTGDELQILDISQVATPTVQARVALPAPANVSDRQLLVANGRAYVGLTSVQVCGAGCTQTRLRLWALDVTNPQQPRLGQQLEIEAGGGVGRWAARGTALYMAAARLRIVDVTNIDAPVLSDYSLGSRPHEFQIVGARAYLLDDQALIALDLSNPLQPAPLSRFPLRGVGTSRLLIRGERAYVLSDGLRVLDIRNPSNPLPLATYSAPAQDFATDGTYVYLTMADGSLHVLQIHPERFATPLLLPLLRRV